MIKIFVSNVDDFVRFTRDQFMKMAFFFRIVTADLSGEHYIILYTVIRKKISYKQLASEKCKPNACMHHGPNPINAFYLTTQKLILRRYPTLKICLDRLKNHDIFGDKISF